MATILGQTHGTRPGPMLLASPGVPVHTTSGVVRRPRRGSAEAVGRRLLRLAPGVQPGPEEPVELLAADRLGELLEVPDRGAAAGVLLDPGPQQPRERLVADPVPQRRESHRATHV